MNSWTDIGLIIAIVIGLISAASLPLVSVNAVSTESLHLQKATRDEPAPWALVRQDRLDAWTASPSLGLGSAASGMPKLDGRQANASTPH